MKKEGGRCIAANAGNIKGDCRTDCQAGRSGRLSDERQHGAGCSGSYKENFHKSYASILNYMEENGYEICGNIRESYIDGVWNKDTAEEWLTEIQIPVRRN